MSDDEVIRFEITDYDLDNEFNPNRNRKAKKEQQIYGVWAKDSDEEDNEDNVRKRTRKQKDFTAPIGFVAGGVQQAGKKKEANKEMQSTEASTSRLKIADSSEEEDANDEPLTTDTAGIRKLGQGMRPPNLGGSVGAWEKHTKGIGAKLLLQMGYQPGKGLGKDLQGISAPVEATVRKGRGAIGAYGPEKAALKAKKEEERRLKEKEEQEKGQSSEKTYNWKKSHKGRYFYRDADDVIQEGKPTMHTIGSELARVPVIDMTGKQRRVLSGYHALRAAAPRYEHEPRRQLQHFSAPQLTHNLQLVVDCCEQDIIQNARELQTAEDEIVVLERDLEECNKKLREQDEVLAKVESIMERVEELNKPDVSLEASYEVLDDLKESYPLEYEMFGLGTIGGNIVSPLLSALLAKWEPLHAPEEPVPTFLKWKKLLTEEAYNSLLWQHFVPRVTSAAEAWEPRAPGAMLRVFGAWAEACPGWLLQQSAARAVLPRLLGALRAWDPTGDTLPLHSWVLPWHELAGAYAPGRRVGMEWCSPAAPEDGTRKSSQWPATAKSGSACRVSRVSRAPLLRAVACRVSHISCASRARQAMCRWLLRAPPHVSHAWLLSAVGCRVSHVTRVACPRSHEYQEFSGRRLRSRVHEQLPALTHVACHVPVARHCGESWRFACLKCRVSHVSRVAGSALSASAYPLIRSRLAAALSAWHPADGSAHVLLAAWRGAWGPALRPLLHHHVLPKLEHCLQHAPVELLGRENAVGPPACTAPWLWCVQWVDLIGAPSIAALAARALLPRWLGALAAWLNTAPPHAAVLASYSEFKKTFPEEVLREPAVRDAFRKALDMMNRSTDLEAVEPPPPPRFVQPEPKEARPEPPAVAHKSFSELLEARCLERGITFVPLAGKTREGRPLYRIGALQCYVIRNVIMYSEDGGRSFAPIGLDRLLNMVDE
ncbi:unnamed protein product, partial [Iphiclides podalirius]